MFFFFFPRHAFAEMIVRKCFSPSTSFSSRASVLVTSLWDECRHGFSSASALLHSSSSYLCSFFFLLSLLSFFCSFFFFGTNNLKRKQNKKKRKEQASNSQEKKNTHTHQLFQHRFFFLFLASRFLCYFIFNLISFFFFSPQSFV